jgi:2-oxoisovalerate dehydrogenase E2 component (dihydrolipoyl transacylase)
VSRYVFKVPDLGEGTVSAEVVAWHVKAGDFVREDSPFVELATDKAVVEVHAPATGRLVSVNGEPGDSLAVGSELAVFELEVSAAPEAAAPAASAVAPAPAPVVSARPEARAESAPEVRAAAGGPPAAGARIQASPATRRRAREAGVDLATVAGTGPGGRITREDVDSALSSRPAPRATATGFAAGPGETTEIKIIGVRRVIAERMTEAKRTIPHFSYIEEIDVTELEALRVHLNERQPAGAPSYSYLPFLVLALVRVLRDFPQCNALYDAQRGVIVRHRAVHVGIATQTPDGLKVPVVRHAERLSLEDSAAEIRRVAEAARRNTAQRQELSGSTITVTSLGRLGGIASTPVINAPEVAIVGVNKAVERPMVYQGAITIRRVMNLSSSFDHRFVDGYDAAAMIQALKERLEHPARIFMP